MKCVSASYILSFLYTPWHIFMLLFGRDPWFCIGRAGGRVVRNVVKPALLWQRRKALFLQSEYKVRGSFFVFLVIKM